MWSKPSSTQPAQVLVVDDEKAVREFTRRVLESSGYGVIEAANGLEGLAVLDRGTPLDLVIADLAMPELSGAEMVCRIRAVRPELKVLYVTGCIDSLLDTRQLWDDEAFLEKPFSVKGLRQAVALLLYGSLDPPAPKRGLAGILNASPRLRRLPFIGTADAAQGDS